MSLRADMPKWKKAKAKEMRRNPTLAEAEAWKLLKGKKFQGLRFYRQSPIRGYIVDFYCPKLKLAIEINGPYHINQKSYDKKRDYHLFQVGIDVVRFSNSLVLYDKNSFMKQLRSICKSK